MITDNDPNSTDVSIESLKDNYALNQMRYMPTPPRQKNQPVFWKRIGGFTFYRHPTKKATKGRIHIRYEPKKQKEAVDNG